MIEKQTLDRSLFKQFIVALALLGLIAGCSGTPPTDSEEDQAIQEEINAQSDLDGLSDEDDDFADLEDEDLEEELGEEEGTEEELADESELEDELDEDLDQEVAEEEDASEEEAVADLNADDGGDLFEEALGSNDLVNVTALDFLASQRGGSVVIKTNGPAQASSRFNGSTNQFVVEIQNSFLPKQFKRPYILKDFRAASFAAINAYQKKDSNVARIVIQVKNGEEPILQKEGDTFIVIPRYAGGVLADSSTPGTSPGFDEAPETKNAILAAKTLEEFLLTNTKFYGAPISIQVKNASIKDVINFISEQSGTNLVVSEEVKGTISVKLRKIPWDQALVTIMKANGLGYVRQGNILRISSIDTLSKERDQREKIIASKKNSEPLRMQIVPISYAEIADLEKQVTKFSTPNRGSVLSDTRTNSLVITDTQDVIQQMLNLVESLDVPPKQVLIEGKIVEATESWDEGFGVNWSSTGSFSPISGLQGINGSPLTLSQSGATSTFGDSFGATTALNFTIGKLDIFGDLTAQLALLESKSMASVLSSPRVITMNKQAANISQTNSIPFNSSQISSTSTDTIESKVEFQQFKLNMDVTPQITAKGSVILDINVSRSSPTGVTSSGSASASNQSSAKTKLIVENGQTAVVGGIFSENESTAKSRVPGLASIPVLGWLFKSNRLSKGKNELVIFLTPRILQDPKVEENPNAQTL